MLTILIPTRNRWGFLARLLHYYADAGLTHRIRVGDSSDPDRSPEAEAVLASVAGRLDVECRPYPGADNFACIAGLLDRVSTPYVAWSADDDFLVPRALDQAVAALTARPEVSAVHGAAALFGVATGQPHGPVAWTSSYRQEALEHDRASARLIAYMSAYFPIIYSVHRTENLQWCYRRVVELRLDNVFGELLPSCLPVVRGKIAKLQNLYMVRQAHTAMTSARLNPDPFEWIAGTDWSRQCGGVKTALAGEVARHDGIDQPEACDVVKQAVWAYVARALEIGRLEYAGWSARSPARWRARLRRVPGLADQYRKFQRLLPGTENALSLSGLSHPSSPYYDDFSLIHQAIVGRVPVAEAPVASAL